MKDKLLALICCLLCLLLCAGAVSVSAESTPLPAQDLADGIVCFAQDSAGVDSVQAWIDTALTEQAGTGAEWYILCLAQSGSYDFSSYEQALLCYLDQNTVTSATTRQKYALCLAAIGSTDAYIQSTLDSSIGSLGIMSYVYGLHLLHNGYQTDACTAEQVIDQILSLQKADGGWAISGNVSDVDVTAMTLQALAPYYGAKENATAAVDAALSLLSSRQNEDGSFSSYGVANPESASQVTIALCALGIDPCTDARFIKNGNTLFDAIAGFSMKDGSFAHTKGGAYSASATAQVLCAATAYLRFASGKTPLYDLDGARPDEVQTPTEESEKDTAPQVGGAAPLSYKPWACLAVVALGGIVRLIFRLLKKRHYKNFIAVGIAVSVLLAAVLLIDIRLPDDYYHGQSESKPNAIGSVTLTIQCKNVPDLDKIEHLPDDGMILLTETYQIEQGETVYDILTEAARKHRLHVDTTGAGESAYVRGISYLYEQQYGDLSGWIYWVNGSSPSVGCGAYTLSDGDEIVWEYSLTNQPAGNS